MHNNLDVKTLPGLCSAILLLRMKMRIFVLGIILLGLCFDLCGMHGIGAAEDEQELSCHDSDYDIDGDIDRILYCLKLSGDPYIHNDMGYDLWHALRDHNLSDRNYEAVLDRLGFRANQAVYKNIHVPGYDGRTALERAVYSGDIKAVMVIVQHPDIRLKPSFLHKVIYEAMLNRGILDGNVDLVSRLVTRELFGFTQDQCKNIIIQARLLRPLRLYLGFEQNSRVFADPNVNAYDRQTGECSLFRAVDRQDRELVEALLTFEDLNMNVSDAYGTTALIQAIIFRYNDILQVLLQNDRPRQYEWYYLNINCADPSGKTPLMWAIIRGNEFAICQLCGDSRLDPGIVDKKNRSALDWAYKMVNRLAIQKIKELMPKRGKKRPRCLRLSHIPHLSDLSNLSSYSPKSVEELVPASPRLQALMSSSSPRLSSSQTPRETLTGATLRETPSLKRTVQSSRF